MCINDSVGLKTSLDKFKLFYSAGDIQYAAIASVYTYINTVINMKICLKSTGSYDQIFGEKT